MYLRRIPWIAILLIVVLRIAIGWQLFYEGLWKTKTLSSPKPWTSVGYLNNSQGPLRATFRRMTGDPNEMDWLNADKVTAKWKKWQSKFARHYGLDNKQKSRLEALVSGPSAFYSDKDAIPELPEGIDLDAMKKTVSVIDYDAENGRLVVNGKKHMSGSEYTKLLRLIPEGDSETLTTFRTQLAKVYERSLRLSYIEKMRAQLLGNSDVAGIKNKKGETQQMGEIDKYRTMIAEYEKSLAAAKQDFQHDHLKKTWGDLQSQRASLVGPIKALESEMRDKAEALVSVKQLQSAGKLGEPWTGLRIADLLTILGLTLCGFCLIIGLFTRFSAIMAAIMLFSFYLAMPPLPGLPEAPGPEHSLIVNKNLIEVCALAAIAALPTGYWFGLDKFVAIIWRRMKGKSGEEDDDE